MPQEKLGSDFIINAVVSMALWNVFLFEELPTFTSMQQEKSEAQVLPTLLWDLLIRHLLKIFYW
jgi:hypothetical protein